MHFSFIGIGFFSAFHCKNINFPSDVGYIYVASIFFYLFHLFYAVEALRTMFGVDATPLALLKWSVSLRYKSDRLRSRRFGVCIPTGPSRNY